MKFDNTYVSIDLDAISANYDAIRQKAGVEVMAVIKADAYGHGAVQIARHLQDRCGFFGVSSMLEALELRRSGIGTPILILGQTPAASYSIAVRERLRPAIFSYEDARTLSAEAVKQGVTAPFHFAVDTGMSRIGFQVTEEAADICARIAALPNLEAEGLFSHFASADSEDLTFAKIQAERFGRFDAMLRSRGVAVKLRHLDNSAGVMNFGHHYEMVRAGIVLYGLYPSDQVDPALLRLTPALGWYSQVTHVKRVESGCPVSYGCTYVAEKPTIVATVPVGYADGYRRNLSNRFYVLIRGKRAPILGRICMDQLMVDVTQIPGVSRNDRVVLVGTDGQESITVEQIAARGDSFNYEFVSGISRRVPRFYYREGKLVNQVHYLLEL